MNLRAVIDTPESTDDDGAFWLNAGEINAIDERNVPQKRPSSIPPPPPLFVIARSMRVPPLTPAESWRPAASRLPSEPIDPMLASDAPPSFRPPRVPREAAAFEASETSSEAPVELRTDGRRRARGALVAVVLITSVAGTWAIARPSSDGSAPRVEESGVAAEPVLVTLRGLPQAALITLDGEEVDTSSTSIAVSHGARHALEVRNDDLVVWQQEFIARGPLELMVPSAVTNLASSRLPREARAIETDATDPVPTAEPSRQARAERTDAPPRSGSREDAQSGGRAGRTEPSENASRRRLTLVRDPGF